MNFNKLWTNLLTYLATLNNNLTTSFIDLLLISQPNLVIESGVHSSLPSHCHHARIANIIYARFNLKVYYPTPMNMKSGIIKKQILIWFSKRFMNLTRKELVREKMLMRKCPFSLLPLTYIFEFCSPRTYNLWR